MHEIITQHSRHIQIISQKELRDPLLAGEYVRAYCHIHGSDHQRSLSINRRTGWGRCFNAACEAIVLVIEWNPTVAGRLSSSYERGMLSASHSSSQLLPRSSSSIVQPVLLLPAAVPSRWQQEERLALLDLDEPMREALSQSKRAHAYLHERGIPLHVAQSAGVCYLPTGLLRNVQGREQRTLLRRWTERILFPLHTPDDQGYIGRSLWRWVPGMDEHVHKSILDQPGAPRRWMKTSPAGWFGYDPEHHPRAIIVVEGTFDRLALLAAGMRTTEVIALAGTAIRAYWFPAHVSTVILALDADAGGEHATDRLIDQLEQAGIRVESCPPPQDRWGKDWNERWRKIGQAGVQPLFEARSALISTMSSQKKGA
jgi:5S rRNA maturation endonuclease (ribonuclease M5)